MDHLQLLAYAEREEAREAKRAAAAGISVMRAELDAATSTSADVQEAQWRAGANRQAHSPRQQRTSSSRRLEVELHGRRCQMHTSSG